MELETAKTRANDAHGRIIAALEQHGIKTGAFPDADTSLDYVVNVLERVADALQAMGKTKSAKGISNATE